MQSKATTVAGYLAELPPDRSAALQKLRTVFRQNIDPRIVEHMNYGMIGYSVPHSVYPPGYHCDPKQPLPFAGLAAQKNHLAFYLFCLYTDGAEQAAFAKAWLATGKKLDMGKSCVRFQRIEDVPLEVVAKALRGMDLERFIGGYEAALAGSRRARATGGGRKAVAEKAAKKKTAKKARK
jgi:hypothetical protein